MPKQREKQGKFKEGLIWMLTIMIALVLPAHGLLSLAQDSTDAANSTNSDKANETAGTAENVTGQNSSNTAANSVVDDYASPLSEEEKALLLKGQKSARFLDRIKLEISSSEDDLMKINQTANDTQQKLDDSREEIKTLKEQLDNLTNRIDNSQKIIENVEGQIMKKKSDIDTLQYELEQEKNAISFQKKMLAEYLQVIFKDREKFNNLKEQGEELNTLKLLLSDNTSADNLRALKYSEILEDEGRKIFERLDEMIDEQETNQKLLELKQRTLTIMYSRLNDEKAQLEIEKTAKNNLLEQTKGEEALFQQLLEKTKAEEADVLTQIDTLRKNMEFVQEKMKTLGDKFNPEDYASLLNIYNSKDLKNYLQGSNDSNAEFAPGWPVNPLKGISAYFHDSAYAGFFHMQHQAVDIPTPQGTPIHAPADGFVYKTADNGYGYSYIMLAHANGYMTLYGHVSSILVNTGDEIKAGDIIGLSGATPGTKGAGVYTTGPHLHFEVIKNGVHVDPLDYLNLAYLRLDSLPEKYVAKALGDQKKVRRMPAKVRVKPLDSNDQQNPTEILNSGIADPNAAVIDSYGEIPSPVTN